MSRHRIRALVLTAGFGTRLRPLTYFMPKPLLPVCGEPVTGRTLRSLGSVGCEVAVLNTHHLASTIPGYFGKSYYGLPLRYSHEEEIQGTSGALFGPRSLLSEAEAVIMINGDSLCDWPLKSLVRRHFKTGAAATLLLHRQTPDDLLGGGVGIDRSGRVTQIRDLKAQGETRNRHVFAGAHVLSPHLLDRIENRPGDIITDLYQPLLEEGSLISSLVTGRRWHDLGTASRYLQASLDWSRGLIPSRMWRGKKVSALADLDPSANLSRALIEQHVKVEAEATIQGSLLLDGARIGKGCQIKDSIVGPGVVLAPASNIEKRMINRFDKQHELGPGESIMGDLVYTPLGV